MDPEVLQEAGREARLLITEDRDFGTLVYAQAQSPPVGVLYVRLGTATPDAVASALLDTVSNPGLTLAGYFTVVEPGRVRQRPLPRP